MSQTPLTEIELKIIDPVLYNCRFKEILCEPPFAVLKGVYQDDQGRFFDSDKRLLQIEGNKVSGTWEYHIDKPHPYWLIPDRSPGGFVPAKAIFPELNYSFAIEGVHWYNCDGKSFALGLYVDEYGNLFAKKPQGQDSSGQEFVPVKIPYSSTKPVPGTIVASAELRFPVSDNPKTPRESCKEAPDAEEEAERPNPPVQYSLEEHWVNPNIQDVEIIVRDANVDIQNSDDGSLGYGIVAFKTHSVSSAEHQETGKTCQFRFDDPAKEIHVFVPSKHLKRMKVYVTKGNTSVDCYVNEITVSSSKGNVSLNTSSSKISITTQSGNIEAVAPADNINIASQSGSVNLELTPEQDGTMNISTMEGDVNIKLHNARASIACAVMNGGSSICSGYGEYTMRGGISVMSGNVRVN
ncbi:MAG: DUF4097 family beta strand repeat-containing protein [Mollicutes bacterium]|nr:DUF4097 family beta strand repeat-containing protein [Mollicutes bacterium]